MRFFTCIIGTELLNGRRADEHFAFVNKELLKRGWDQWASFVIKDEPLFLAQTFEFIKNQPNSAMFCFGGIGATPDDYTRDIASKVFTGSDPVLHEEAAQIITDKFGDAAYPNRILMAHIPKGAGLLTNVVNQIPGFYLENRFFFMPGFPQMAQAMVVEALDKFYPKNKQKYSITFTAFCSEEALIFLMKQMPLEIELSSLPIMDGNNRATEIYLASYDKNLLDEKSTFFLKETEAKNIKWRYGGYFDS